MNKRATIIVKGRVQKMGYRLMIDRIAFGLDLKGTVENLKDGSVKIICEGPEPNLRTFCKLIKIRKYPVRVDSTRIKLSAATGEFKEFEPLLDERLDSNPNWKLNLGISKLLDLTDGQLEMLGAIESVGANVTKMDSNMGHNFDRLDNKYGEFGRTLTGVATEIKKSGKAAKATGGHIKTMARDTNGVKGAMTGMASDIKAIRNAATAPRKRKTPVPA